MDVPKGFVVKNPKYITLQMEFSKAGTVANFFWDLNQFIISDS